VRAAWKKFRHRLEAFAVSVLAKLIPLMPRSMCYHVAQIGGALAAQFDRAGRRVAFANLSLVLGAEISAEGREQLVRESYQNFARTMLDLFWSPRLTSQNFRDYIEFDHAQFRAVGIEPEQPFVFGCYHYGNFEWLSLAGGFLGYRGTIIAQEFKNPLLDPIFKKLREQSGHQMVAREGGIIRLYKALRRKSYVAILIDLTIPPKIPTVAIDCFGLKTSVTFAHAWLHQQTGAPLITAHCEPLPHGRYRVVLHRPQFAPNASLQQIAQACWDEFEPHVRENPAPWLWMYKHWRYRPGVANRANYPFYANFSEDFEIRLHESGFPAVLREAKSPAPSPA
jgi:KDO2-lipid IV(A) lauroyltransferase